MSEDLLSIEGYLKKYTNFFKRWKTRYAVLKNGILSFYSKDKKKVSSSHSMFNASIKTKSQNSKSISIILKNKNQIFVKAASIEEKNKWLVVFGNSIKIATSNNHKDYQSSSPIDGGALSFKEEVIKILKSTIFNKNNQLDANIYKLSSAISQMGNKLIDVMTKMEESNPISNSLTERENSSVLKFKDLINFNDQMKVK